ncbi:P-loop containing nucleoside triphosphate hydrolase protein [Xylariales sp. AK1849]|nr:P-loop containing nucleoside triphosphate hydrolase protein [Xylariales sp. AK1849]
MDEHLAGPIKRYEEARAGKLKTIAFEDLWMLFKPGDVIFTPFRRGSPASINPAPPPPPPPGMRPGTVGQRSGGIVRQGIGRDTPQAYRIISVLGGRHFAVPLGDKAKKTNVYSQLKVLCYYIDFNGLRYDCVSDVFNFRPFENEVEITNLDAYPLAYASIDEKKGKEQMTEYLKRRGQQFVEVSEVSHKLYEGLAFGATREEINTPVIIDFALAYQNTPGLRPQFTLPTVDFFNQTMRNTRAELFEAVIQTRTGRKFDWYWRQQTGLTTRGRTELLETLDDYPSVKSTDAECISKLQTLMESNGQILLLPGMVHAFALRNRKWVSLELSLVQNSQYEDGWKDLILPPGHKEMVRAVVENHATGSRSTVGMAKGTTEVDIVRGKGKGCIILLHGEPGVGKTSTAECVAAFTKRPLFPITCGDIGYEPDEVERNLEKHFTLAHKWGCVMLLDEADVFLAKRSRDDIKRNGLVSVFLRILEYYPGILFLTTNRVGSFDDAFRSRLHLTLYYPKLDKRQTIQIWDMNLRRVSEANENRALAGQQSIDIHHDKIIKFAKKNWETLSWNGRQIRNAFQTAIALAEFDVRDGNGKQAVMSKKQFKTIAKASMQFDDYLFHVHGGTDESANARKEQVRWDYEVMDRPGTKRELSDSDSDLSSDSSSSSSGSSSDDSDDSDDVSSDDAKKRRKKKKGKEKEREREKERKSKKKSDDRGKKSKSKKDKH